MIAQAYSCLCCQPRPQFPDPYCFHFGPDCYEANRRAFQTNEIKTTKYNILNFVPKSILTQYQRLANLYFLIVAIIATIPGITPLNPVLIWIPLSVVLFISIIKELYEDYSRFKMDREVNEQKQVTVARRGELQKIKWKDVVVGDLCRIEEQEIFPADLLLVSSSDPDGIAYIETATLDGEQTSKIRYAFHELNLKYTTDKNQKFMGKFEAEIPNPALAQFRGILEVGPHKLSINDNGQLLFRGARLKKTKWIWGIAVYTGQCSKIMMNGQSFITKLSTVEQKLNYLLIVMLAAQLIACMVMAVLSTNKEMEMRDNQDYLILRQNYTRSKLLIANFLLFFIEYSSLIPVSLIVSIEIAKTAQSYFIDFDQLMHSSWRKRKAYARIAALNQQLGQIEYIFCDKTGTLTKNQLKFHTAVIGNQFYDFKFNNQNNSYQCDRLADDVARLDRSTQFLEEEIVLGSKSHRIDISDYGRLLQQYFMCLLVCNNINTVQHQTKGISYESESPDELALIQMAKNFGFIFLKRDKSSILVEIRKEIHRIQIVETFHFTSDRKRMSVIIKWRDSYLLYTKGADNIILERVLDSPFRIVESVDKLCQSGLRSLLVGVRMIDSQRIQEFLNDLRHATIEHREIVVRDYAKEFEKDITILGATGLLDELQDEVPQTLRDFQRADIRVWMLTGDKLQTAIEIGKACNLITCEHEVVLMRKTQRPMKEIITQCKNKALQSLRKHALVIQGSVLTQIFNDQSLQKEFAILTVHFTGVICCRMLPVQKSQAVRMIKTHLKKICLAVGDGGNDVSMIKQANIGIGIYGQEGMSAVQASDYALPEFKMIWRLLFVHGRWNYMRICQMILYFAYKSILFTVPRFLFSFMNAYSGQPIYDDYYIALYNVVFTALPLLVRALFQQDVNYVTKKAKEQNQGETCVGLVGQAKHLPKGYKINEGMRKLFPKIYFVGQKNEIFNLRQCILWTAQAILMGVCLFFVIERVFGSTSIMSGGYSSNLQLVSITIYTTIIMLDTLKLCMQVRHWTKLLFLTIVLLSIAPYLSFIWILNYKFKRPVQGVLIVYFTSIKTYFSVLVIAIILIGINGIMIYLRFHSQKILKKMATALEQDCDMVSYISSQHEGKTRELKYSEQQIKPTSNKVINEAKLNKQ